VKTFALWSNELQEMDRLITQDVRNNSAWNHRYFVLSEGPLQGNVEACEEEVEYAWLKIKLAPSNPSPWNYLNGVVQLAKKPLRGHKKVLEWAQGQLESTAIPLLAFVAKHQHRPEAYKKLAELDPIREAWWNSFIA
jgi:protein farnesyltransferase/geranylgeranyltransferase type-1 subunit alpha